ncbi:hypothetical protein [Luteibacter sp. CQ10]|uniref:hypothetical protein n=1 Tax=Luteibacter sp. CQ10 TaxID=2805821 RepID=UPI0034A32A63
MNAKFLPSEQAAINAVRKSCEQDDLNAWFDQSQVKARFKKASMQTQGLRCCYCQKYNDSTNNNHWDLEHILSEDSYPQFFAVDDNLVVACKRCNGAKGNQDVLLPKPTLGHQLSVLPMDSESYAIPHPRIDSWADCLSHVNYQIYKAKNGKGLELVQVCKLNEPAIKRAGLTYESIVAAARRNFFDVLCVQIPWTLPDEDVLEHMARLTESAENERRDMLLTPLSKRLDSLNKKAERILPKQAVKEAKQLALKQKKGKVTAKKIRAKVGTMQINYADLAEVLLLTAVRDGSGPKKPLMLEHKSEEGKPDYE